MRAECVARERESGSRVCRSEQTKSGLKTKLKNITVGYCCSYTFQAGVCCHERVRVRQWATRATMKTDAIFNLYHCFYSFYSLSLSQSLCVLTKLKVSLSLNSHMKQ